MDFFTLPQPHNTTPLYQTPSVSLFFFLMILRTPRSTLFPYTTLFRSFTFDADGQHAPESLLVLEEVLERSGADVVLGSRTLGSALGIPKARKLLLKAALAFTQIGRAHV